MPKSCNAAMDRRTVLQGAASLVAPDLRPLMRRREAAGFGEGKLLDLLSEYLRLDGAFAQSMADLERAERDALARGMGYSDCPKVAAAFEEEGLCLRAMTETVRRAARTPAANLDDIVLKLALWRLSDADPGTLDNPCDMLSFSAYRDLLALTGCEALAHPADEEVLTTLQDDGAFVYK